VAVPAVSKPTILLTLNPGVERVSARAEVLGVTAGEDNQLCFAERGLYLKGDWQTSCDHKGTLGFALGYFVHLSLSLVLAFSLSISTYTSIYLPIYCLSLSFHTSTYI
jgi:hypothetical protein